MSNKLFIRQDELARLLGVSNTTIWRWRKSNHLPKPIALSNRVIGWRTVDIDAWLESQMPSDLM